MSAYLEKPMRTEAEARAQFSAKVVNFADYERRTISSCLPKGKTMEDALLRAKTFREQIWTRRIPEAKKIAQLLELTTELMGGNATAGQLLASAAIWEPS